LCYNFIFSSIISVRSTPLGEKGRRRIIIRTSDKWIRFRIREAQKHVDPIRIPNISGIRFNDMPFQHLIIKCYRFGGTLPLFLFIFTLIEQTYNIYIYTTRRVPRLLSLLLPLGGGPPLGCRAEIRTQACRTASRRATV
jgi:hypothetical protein